MDASRAYEERIMSGDKAAEPPEDYIMSDGFRDWMVAEMRNEVMAQVSQAGLDRMSIVKAEEE